MNIYVGNLPYSTTEDELRELFEAHGEVDRAKVIHDRETGRSKGFGFVEMSDNAAAQQAIEALSESDFAGRPLKVNEARPREEGGGNRYGGKPRGGGGGDRGDRGDRGGRFGNDRRR